MLKNSLSNVSAEKCTLLYYLNNSCAYKKTSILIASETLTMIAMQHDPFIHLLNKADAVGVKVRSNYLTGIEELS